MGMTGIPQIPQESRWVEGNVARFPCLRTETNVAGLLRNYRGIVPLFDFYDAPQTTKVNLPATTDEPV